MKLTHKQYYNHTNFKVFKLLMLTDERINRLNFNKIDNRFYYIYRITNIDNGTYYYGSRVSATIPQFDLGIKYFSSSDTKLSILENKNNYKFKVVKIFNNNGDKILYESFLHNYFDVTKSDKFWNKSNQTPFGFDTTGVEAWNLGLNKHNTKSIQNGINKMVGTRKKNDSYKSGKLKEIETRKKKDGDGLSSYEKTSLKIRITMSSDEWKNTIGKKQKIQERATKLIKDENGLNANERGALKLKEQYLKVCNRYNIYKSGVLIRQNITQKDCDALHQRLKSTTINCPLGHNNRSKSNLIRFNKSEMIGWYSELIIV